MPSGSAGKNSKNFWNLEKKGGTTTPHIVPSANPDFYELQTIDIIEFVGDKT
ncbi:hypothetical protein GCM10017706_31620 [Lactococcus lactis subsp. hordniae]